jgi:endonuclease YncB( thermonuclease family)
MRTIGLFLAGALVVSACSTSGGAPQRTDAPDTSSVTTSRPADPSEPTTPPTTIVQPEGSEEATVIKVFDGDSMLVEIGGRQEEVRLLGINAPERDECFGTQAGDRLRELAGSTVWLIADGEGTDRFGRLLRLVFTPTAFVNADLVAGGFALALQDDAPLAGILKAAEERAYDARVGMWTQDLCGGAPSLTWIEDVNPNPPGPDNDNLNDEWIDIFSGGPPDLVLTGFILRDESSSNRFEFPFAFALRAGTTVRIHTGCGERDKDNLYWCNESAVWNNAGDTVILQTPDGTVVDRFVYTDS